MMELLEKVLVSRHGLFATAVAGFGGLFSDALFGKFGFVATLVVALIILLIGIRKENEIDKIYSGEVIPIPIVVSIDDHTPVKMLLGSLVSNIAEIDSRFSNLKDKLEKYFRV